MKLIKKIKSVLGEPARFFESLKKEKGIGDAFVYFAVLSLFAAILGIIVGYFFYPVSTALMTKVFGFELPMVQLSFVWFLAFGLIGYAFGLIISFIWAAILHVWILIFGGREAYSKTYQLSVYSRTPGILLSWIPFVNYFIWIWSLLLLIIGTEKVHKLPKLRAILMYVIPVIIFAVLWIVMMLFLIGFMKANPALFVQ